MGKFRSKIKGKTKGQRWQKGQSSNSNPKKKKYRDMAKSRFFQENCGNSELTQQAVMKHDKMQTYSHSTNAPNLPENELIIAKDFENMSMRSGQESDNKHSDTTGSGTFKTFQTFASDWSQCSNVSFTKLLNMFDSNNALHKRMLAILAAVTEVIKEQGGTESSTEYFAALMEILKTSEDQDKMIGVLSLLSMGIKSVPQAVLRKQYSDYISVFMKILENHTQFDSGPILRSTIGCISVLLRAQEYAVWQESYTINVFDNLISFVMHYKPKVRKTAQHAIMAILHGSCFMIPSEDPNNQPRKYHPILNRVVTYALAQLMPKNVYTSVKPVLYMLTMLRDVLPLFPEKHIKTISEAILTLMNCNNVFVKLHCLHTLHTLFETPLSNCNISADLVAKLTRVLRVIRPSANDSGQVLAWVAVLQQGYSCLAGRNLNLCIPYLPAFVHLCVSELWLSQVADVNAAATTALKGILLDCVDPAIKSETCLTQHKSHIDNIFNTIGTGLDNPFNQAIKHVILTLAVCFEIGNNTVAHALAPLLKKMIERRESHNFVNEKEVEYATGCAIKSMGPEFVLNIITLRDGNNINLDRSWLIPVLKDKIANSNLKYFATEILEMATFCRKKSRELAEANDLPGSHTYDLLCNQFWALLPSFCNGAKDVKENFKALARVLGNVLKDNPEFRLSVMQSLRKLISCSVDNEEDRNELSRFAKNYVPILLNIYLSPVKGSTAEGQRLAALETIQVYLTISEQSLREELFTNALQQFETCKDNHFQRESILDVIRLLVLYQNSDQITNLFDKWVFPLCKTVLEDPNKAKRAKKLDKTAGAKVTKDGVNTGMKYKDKARLLEMEHKKAYRILEEIFKSDMDSCKQFLMDNHKKITKLLINSLNKVADSCKAARLRCIEHLIKLTKNLNAESKLLKSAVAESVICTKDINSKCRQCAFNVINTVGDVLKHQDGGMDAFIHMLFSGLSAPLPRIISATLRALASALYNFSENMGLETVQGLLEKVSAEMLKNNREIVASALSFIKVYTKVIPTDVLSGSLPLIVKTLSSMSEDCKRHSRLEIKYFLSRMTRKYGAEIVEKLIPAEDEIMIKRIRNLRKMDNRKKRQKENQRNKESDSDTEFSVKGTSKTLEDILHDSDSEMEYVEEERPKVKAKKGINRAWIQDDPENIVDLTDVSSSRKITATDPTEKKVIEENPKKKDGGFKTAPDGRLIILDDKTMKDMVLTSSDSDTEDTDDEASAKKSKLVKAAPKRKYDDILSIRSGQSGKSKASTATVGGYRAGGKGIHRPLSSAGSVASAARTDYRSKKAKGDIKKKGNKHDPYAYLPLARKNLNKRKRTVTSKQFRGVVKSKTKGVKVRTKRNK